MKEKRKDTRLLPANGEGETVRIADIIDALEAAPSKDEVMQALRDLRRDKVKAALGKTVKAAGFDKDQAVRDFLEDGDKSDRTKAAYTMMLGKLFSYADREKLPVLALGRADANRYRRWLETKHSANTTRLALAAALSFWKYLEVTEVVQANPFAALALPKRQFKKVAVTGQEASSPVMSEEEAQAIIDAVRATARMKAKDIGGRRARESARVTLPILLVLKETGVRVGDAITLHREAPGRVSFKVKGNKVRSMAITADLEKALPKGARPFSGVIAKTVTEAMHRLTTRMFEEKRIRHPFTPHDFRHSFAVALYQRTHDVLAVQRALGHASLSATQTYLSGLGVLEQ
jgi:integrase